MDLVEQVNMNYDPLVEELMYFTQDEESGDEEDGSPLARSPTNFEP